MVVCDVVCWCCDVVKVSQVVYDGSVNCWPWWCGNWWWCLLLFVVMMW